MQASWKSVHDEMMACTKCRLCETRQHVVPGEGNPQSRVMFVGEGPGAQEDAQGRPFVGPAGQLLDKMLSAIGLSRENAYIANMVKCRPPGNRVPEADEVAACLPFLRVQTGLIRPQVIVCLGATAGKALMNKEMRITKERGIWHERKGIWMIATYHPSALLRDPSKKGEAWEDMQKIRDKLAELPREEGTLAG